jgi:LL-diaminopimelate aminotransferase
MTCGQFAATLLEKAGVSITPGTVFGAQGEGYVRISLGMDTDRIREAMRRWKQLAF